MSGDARYSIGDLARRTGLPVRTIRFYADRGIVPPTDRSPAGHRRFDVDAVARLDLVRTLRELGLDLATIRKVVDREVSAAQVAAAHAEALAVRIRTLRLRRAVLTAVAKRGSAPEEMDLMHKLARLSEDERRSLIDEFLAAAFGDLRAVPEFAGIMRSLTPELPDNPDTEQVEAWIELAELAQDPGFRAGMRRMAEQYAADQARRGLNGPHRDVVAIVRDEAGTAHAAGVAPASAEADRVVAAVLARLSRTGDDASRRWVLAHVETANDPRRERYLDLLAVINGWSPPDRLAPVLGWFTDALRARQAS